MANQSQRGGQKKGAGTGEQKEHQGVRPDSTTQNKSERKENAERRAPKQTGQSSP
jgi:hypothetical protein